MRERIPPVFVWIQRLWWLIHKDFIQEFRARRAWPRTLLLGLVLMLVATAQIDLPIDEKANTVSGFLWITVFLAATVSIEQSIASESDDGCWQTLKLYPNSPSLIFLAKTVVNAVTIAILTLVIIPMFVVFTDVPLLAQPGSMAVIAILSSVGLASVGTLIAALTKNVRNGGGLLALVLLPLVTPILLSSVEATRITLVTSADSLWWWWIQLLIAFALSFIVLGTIIIDFAMEE